MKERFPALIALFLLIVLVLGTWWAAGYTQRAVDIDPPRRYTHEMDAWARNFIMLRTGPDGQPINRLQAVYGEHFPDDDSYVLTDPRAVGLRPGTPVTVATGKQGIMYGGGKRILLEHDAHMHRQADNETPALDVRSEKLEMLPDEDIVFTDLPAVVVRGQSQMQGKGMKYNNRTRQLEVYAATNVEISGAESQPRTRPGAAAAPATNAPAARATGPGRAAPDNAQPTPAGQPSAAPANRSTDTQP